MHSLTLIGVVAFLFSLVNAAWPPQKALAPLYRVQPGSLDRGGCDAWHANISAIYEEAVRIVTKGHEAAVALNYLPEANNPGATDPLRFGFFAQGLLTFFGVRVNPQTGPIPPPPGSRGGIFEDRIRDGVQWTLNNIIAPNPDGSKAISCTANGVAYIAPTDKDPRVAQQFADDTKRNEWPELNAHGEFPFGALWWEYGKGILAIRQGQSTVPKDHICMVTAEGEAAAVTMHDWGAIFICESLLEMPTQTAHSLLKNVIQPGYDLYSYDLQNIASKTLVHELTHLWDSEARDAPSVSEANPPSLWGTVAPLTGPPGRAYGYYQCQLLAWNYPPYAAINSDSMANFAFLMYAYDFDNAGYGWDFIRTKEAIKYGTWEKDE